MLPSFLHLFQGIITGVIISVSVGPMALITMKRTAEFGLRAGVISAITIALIDTSVAVLVLLGLNRSISFFTHVPKWIHTLGVIFIFIYGIYLFTKQTKITTPEKHPLKKHFYDTLVLSLLNPSTYVSFGVIALLLTRFLGSSLFGRIEILIGFLFGTFAWWIALVYFAFSKRSHVSAPRLQKWVGAIIMALSFIALITPGRAGYFPFIKELFRF
jgi:threonine/homoserine/homoserine lactone efflux protein